MRKVSSLALGAVLLCAAGPLAVSSWAQNGGPGTGNTVIGHEARPDGTPNTGPVGPAESAVVPGQNAINGQTKARDCDVPGQNAKTPASDADCVARNRTRRNR
jgi:hypothetical protein